MSFIQLLYFSRDQGRNATGRAQLEMLRDILSVSRRNNARDEITGFLLFDQTWFFQILEGDSRKVMSTYERIQKDRRHGEVTLMSMRDIHRRSFPRWSMGGAMRDLDQQEIYLRHGIGGPLDPARILAPTILALAMDLQDFQIARTADALRPTG